MPSVTRSARVVIALALALAAGCGDHPTKPTPSPNVAKLTIDGPSSLAPGALSGSGEVGRYTATAVLNDGTVQDVTAKATWTTSSTLRQTAGKPGVLQAAARGEGSITAAFGGATASLVIRVLEPGTFVLSGRVSNAATGAPLSLVDAYVQIAGRFIDSRISSPGSYAIYGVVGPVTIHARAADFLETTQDVTVTSDTNVDLVLTPIVPAVDLTGAWTMSLSASASCRSVLPAIARDREYDVVITQQGTSAAVRLTSPTLRPYVLQGFFNTDRAFEIDIESGWGDDFIEHLSPTETLFIEGTIEANVTTQITGTFSALLRYQNGANPPLDCLAGDHSVIMRRK